MINRGQIYNRSDVLRQVLSELVEQVAQLEGLQQKLQIAERNASERTIRACKHLTPAVERTAPPQ